MEVDVPVIKQRQVGVSPRFFCMAVMAAMKMVVGLAVEGLFRRY